MAGIGEVTLGASRHLPAHGVAKRACEHQHRTSQAGEERRNRVFFLSQARRGVLYEVSQAGSGDQGTKHAKVVSRDACMGECREPNTHFVVIRAC